eukprot:14486868-Alexandrium_andersonii.AAC.1
MGRAKAPEPLEGAHGAHRLLVHALRVLVVRDVVRDEARREWVTGLVEHVEHYATHLSVHVKLLDVVCELAHEGVVPVRVRAKLNLEVPPSAPCKGPRGCRSAGPS